MHRLPHTMRGPRAWLAGAGLLALSGAAAATVLPTQPIQAANESQAAAKDKSHAQMLSQSFRAAAKDVLPSVVTIEHTAPAPKRTQQRQFRNPLEGQGQNPFGQNSPFGDMFNDPQFRRFFEQMPNSPGGQSGSRQSAGSGVIIDDSGIILTNNHVVTGGGKVTVRLSDGREFEAVEVKTDPMTDIAVVRIEGADNLKAADLGSTEDLQIGDWVLALGQPFGLEDTVTAGIISAKGRGLGITERGSFLQTDAAINPGNSGGPLVNLDGEVVGINTAISTQSGGYQGVGFAIPIEMARWVSKQLIEKGSVQRAYLGVAIQQVTADLADQFGVDVREGVAVTQIFPGTPADEAGLKPGDVIVSFGGEKVSNPRQLQVLVERTEIGEKASLEVIRDGKPLVLKITGREQPDDFGRTARSPAPKQDDSKATEFENLGLEVANLDADVARQLGLKEDVEGVVITAVTPNSPAAAAGLSDSMVIVQVNRKPVTNVEEFEEAFKAKSLEEGVLLLVKTQEGSRFVVLRDEG